MLPLLNVQINLICRTHSHTSGVYRGCFSPNTLPLRIFKYPSFLICNNRNSSESGEHWMLLLFPSPHSQSEFFDSLGRDATFYAPEIERVLLANGNGSYKMNSVAYQEAESQTCGYYCLWLADMRCQNKTFETSLSLLSPDNPRRNESYVTSYVMQHMRSE